MQVKNLNRTGALVKAGYAWQRQIFGKGIGIAVLDTGIYPHPDFGNRIIAFEDFIYHKRGVYDDCGHGTHIAGIAAGDGSMSKGYYRGIAPESSIIACKVLDYSGNGSVEHVIRGLDWVVRNKERYNIRIVNISVGTISKEEEDEECELVKAVNSVWDEGLVVCVAAGNNGPDPYSITTPGISRKVITVGSSDSDEAVEVSGRTISDYSGRGPSYSCIIKPDLVAPGSNIYSCQAKKQGMRGRSGYVRKSGTSMSTPMVSGAVALLLSKYPHLTNGEVKRRLCESATELGWPSSRQGFGMLNIENLFKTV